MTPIGEGHPQRPPGQEGGDGGNRQAERRPSWGDQGSQEHRFQCESPTAVLGGHNNGSDRRLGDLVAFHTSDGESVTRDPRGCEFGATTING